MSILEYSGVSIPVGICFGENNPEKVTNQISFEDFEPRMVDKLTLLPDAFNNAENSLEPNFRTSSKTTWFSRVPADTFVYAIALPNEIAVASSFIGTVMGVGICELARIESATNQPMTR